MGVVPGITFIVLRRCSGRGTWNKNPCKECSGAGQTNQRQKITVKLCYLFITNFYLIYLIYPIYPIYPIYLIYLIYLTTALLTAT